MNEAARLRAQKAYSTDPEYLEHMALEEEARGVAVVLTTMLGVGPAVAREPVNSTKPSDLPLRAGAEPIDFQAI